ncbi:MAG TPA: H-X9-DG-CTERM domain-containing protein, partial [Pirellulaceae bacterium]|nr:H-X9-DG-CTERM domain-containing protein [Pirellulaceae bacterium]
RAPGSSNSTTTGYAPCPMFQGSPQYKNANDSTSGGQTPHTGTMNTGFGDGSVRALSANMDATIWGYLCDPRDRNVVGNY